MLPFLFLVVLIQVQFAFGQQTVSAGLGFTRASLFNYTTVAPPNGWETPGFDDSQWNQGRSPLGYETNPNEQPAGGFGTNLSPDPPITEIWLRATFDPLKMTFFQGLRSATLRVASDNSADVYVNGELIVDEASRNVNHNINFWNVEQPIPLNFLAAAGGQSVGALDLPLNTIAVRVINPNQNNGNPSTDLFFDMEIEYFVGTQCRAPLVRDVCGVCEGDGSACVNEYKPTQIALHMTKSETEMRISWVTESKPASSLVKWGTSPNDLSNVIQLDASSQYNYRNNYLSWFIHNVLLTDLPQGARVYYQVGGPMTADQGSRTPLSEISYFDVQSSSHHQASAPKRPVCLAVMADQGIFNGAPAVMQRLADAVNRRELDLVLFPGDLCYNNGRTDPSPNNWWDIWGRMRTASAAGAADAPASRDPQVHFNLVESLGGSKISWMFATGNHEDSSGGERWEFYRPRIPQPEEGGGPDGLWYSFNYEHIHVISLSSEHDYSPGSAQMQWLEQDLITANEPANRMAHPWIVAMAHRPPFNSNSNYRSFVAFRDSISPLFDRYGVDLALFGHEHCYERTYPVNAQGITDAAYNVNDPLLGSPERPFAGRSLAANGTRGTVYSVVGTAGAGLRPNFLNPQPAWSAYRTGSKYGYVQLCFDESNGLDWQFIDASPTEQAANNDRMSLCRTDSCNGYPRRRLEIPITWWWTDTNPSLVSGNDWQNLDFQPTAEWKQISANQVNGNALLTRNDTAGPNDPLPPNGNLWLRAVFHIPSAYLRDPGSGVKRAPVNDSSMHWMLRPSSFELLLASRAGADVRLNGDDRLLDDEATRFVYNRPGGQWHRRPTIDTADLKPGTNVFAVQILAAGTSAGEPALTMQLSALLRPDSAAALALDNCVPETIDPATGLCTPATAAPTPLPPPAPTNNNPEPQATATIGVSVLPDGNTVTLTEAPSPAVPGSQPTPGSPTRAPQQPSPVASAAQENPSDNNLIDELNLTMHFLIVVPILVCCAMVLLFMVCYLMKARRRDQEKYSSAVLDGWRQDVGRIRGDSDTGNELLPIGAAGVKPHTRSGRKSPGPHRRSSRRGSHSIPLFAAAGAAPAGGRKSGHRSKRASAMVAGSGGSNNSSRRQRASQAIGAPGVGGETLEMGKPGPQRVSKRRSQTMPEPSPAPPDSSTTTDIPLMQSLASSRMQDETGLGAPVTVVSATSLGSSSSASSDSPSSSPREKQ